MDPRHNVRVAMLSLLMVLAGCTGDTDAPTPRPEPSEVRTIEVSSEEPTSIAAGTYRIPSSAWSVADFTITFPKGWTVQYGHVFAKHADEEDEFGVYAVVIDEIFTDACRGDEETTRVGPGVDDLVDALREQPGSAAGRPVDTTLGDHPATRIDLTVPRDLDLRSCSLAEAGIEGVQIWYRAPADVEGRRQVFLTQHRRATSDEDRAELQSVLDSVRIES